VKSRDYRATPDSPGCFLTRHLARWVTSSAAHASDRVIPVRSLVLEAVLSVAHKGGVYECCRCARDPATGILVLEVGTEELGQRPVVVDRLASIY
jgi:hypothetical protein